MSVLTEDAEIGKRYKVTLEDCCIRGEFTSVVAEKKYEPDPDEEDGRYLDSITFANGVVLTEFGQVLLEPAPEQP